MAKVKLDKVDGAVLHQSFLGERLTRQIIVSDLRRRDVDRLREAAWAPGVPRQGDAHPTAPGLVVHELTVRPLDEVSAEVEVIYGQALTKGQGRATLKVGAVSELRATHFDRDGELLLVGYRTSPGGAVTQQVAQATYAGSAVEARFERVDQLETLAAAKQYVGAINSSRFMGEPPGTWLCTVIENLQDEQGGQSRKAYVFRFRAQGWEPMVTYADDTTGRPPDDLDTTIGAMRASVYPKEDFRQLGLTRE